LRSALHSRLIPNRMTMCKTFNLPLAQVFSVG
jgi:hypothetical protein